MNDVVRQQEGERVVGHPSRRSSTLKRIGGSDQEAFNQDLVSAVAQVLPRGPMRTLDEIAHVAVGSLLAFEPKDAIEGALVAQITAANAAALEMYRKSWAKDCHPDLRLRYLALADKASRTVAVLAEALDRHRGRGQQQITVRHVTVNADQAMVADRIVTGGNSADRGDGDDR